ncbi:lipase family protein [Nocardioides sp. QY071]|uniref:lipase family protein n=1 Tax=Nocardioides sp. QY071 TaxID=3044187 RepID=UPI00249AE5CB|nr:lipase family protein [Nocardioides sp. QY071]WGY04229.1 lipase family protein [Nocardioides sp. QY071]
MSAVVAREPARGRAALAAAGESWRVSYPSGSSVLTGLVHLPAAAPPIGGWPVVTYGHMTTGGSDRSAPSTAVDGHPELRRMTQGDGFAAQLLGRGIAVLQPDYAGLGSPGPHPYLIGPALATSVLDLLVAARASFDLSGRWVSAGHSEGAVAALHAAAVGPPAGVSLLGCAVVAPVTRMDRTIGLSLRWPLTPPGFGVVPALVALMISGAATVDPQLRQLVDGDGLSDRARRLWPQLGERTLTELAHRSSFGALAPGALLGARGDVVRDRLLGSLRAHDVAGLSLPVDLPLRIDAATLDEVAPWWLTRSLVRGYRAAGLRVEPHWWRTGHSGVLGPGRAPAPAARWVAGLVDTRADRLSGR